jgi:tetratricopeptide (TPR) repeat protein
MTPSRRERIESMLADDPRDTFLRYSLAMELDKEDDHERSLETLRGLMADAPPYVPAFFMSAQQLARLSRVDEARTVLRQGIEQARQQGNAHAAGEMSEFLASLRRSRARTIVPMVGKATKAADLYACR